MNVGLRRTLFDKPWCLSSKDRGLFLGSYKDTDLDPHMFAGEYWRVGDTTMAADRMPNRITT